MKDLLISLAILLPVYIALFTIMVVLLKRINKDFNTIENKDDNPYIEDAGKRGEYYVNKTLEELVYYNGGYLYKNIILKDCFGHQVEIDHLYICRSGVYIIETKCWRGTFKAHDGSNYWKVNLENKKKSRHSPIIQNDREVYFFKKQFPLIENIKQIVVVAIGDITNVKCKNVCEFFKLEDYLMNQRTIISNYQVEYYNSLIKNYLKIETPVITAPLD